MSAHIPEPNKRGASLRAEGAMEPAHSSGGAEEWNREEARGSARFQAVLAGREALVEAREVARGAKGRCLGAGRHDDAVAAGALRRIEGVVGAVEEVVGRLAAVGLEDGDTDAHRHLRGVSEIFEAERGDGGAMALGETEGELGR